MGYWYLTPDGYRFAEHRHEIGESQIIAVIAGPFDGFPKLKKVETMAHVAKHETKTIIYPPEHDTVAGWSPTYSEMMFLEYETKLKTDIIIAHLKSKAHEDFVK